MALSQVLGVRTPGDFWRVAWRSSTYRSLLYLLTGFPLGLTYFVLLVTGVSLAFSLVIIWVGIPLLVLTVLMWRKLGAFERELAMLWLGVQIPPMGRPSKEKLSLWQRMRQIARDPMTWKSLLFVFLKFPVGLFSFIAVLLLVSGSLGLVAAPVMYLAALTAGGGLDPLTLVALLGAAIIGVPCFFLALHILNGLAWLQGQLARLLLGMSESEQQVAEARAVARLAQAQAARADQSRRELIVNVSHELRTPIASIRGHVESLLMAENPAGSPPTDQHEYLEIVARETERLGALVDDLLALARAEAGELRLDLAPADVGGVAEEVWATLAPLAKRERQVTLVREIAPGLPPVWADRARLMQVLLNLVRNAITYTPAGGIISIRLMQSDAAHLALSVADTGIGIPAEDLPRVFERFYRTDASRARATGGFGLGLAIVRDLVQAMGGTVSVASREGEGSAFTVTLQIARQPAG